jgi:hypothetical protein
VLGGQLADRLAHRLADGRGVGVVDDGAERAVEVEEHRERPVGAQVSQLGEVLVGGRDPAREPHGRQVGGHPVRAGLAEGLGVARLVAPVDSQHQAAAGLASSRHAAGRVLDEDRLVVLDAHLAHRPAHEVGLAREVVVAQRLAVGDHVEEVEHPGHLQHVPAIAAGRDDGQAHAAALPAMHRGHRVAEGLDPVALEDLAEAVVLSQAHAPDGVPVGRIVGRSLGQGDTARGQEVADAVEARLAVDVPAVVVRGERRVVLALGVGARGEQCVERLLPGALVDARGAGDHAVHVEDHGGERAGSGLVHESPSAADGSASGWARVKVREAPGGSSWTSPAKPTRAGVLVPVSTATVRVSGPRSRSSQRPR